MITKPFLPSLIPAALLSLSLIGCGGDKNNHFLDVVTEPGVASLTAYPQVFVLKQGDTQHIDLTQSVSSYNVSSWALSELDDKSGLGEILSRDNTALDYKALKAGAGFINYTVKGGRLSASSQIVLAVNAGETPSNNLPTANNVTLTTLSNANIGVDLRPEINDIDGDTLQINSLVSASGRFTLTDGYQVTFTPNDFVGVDQAVYGVDDGRGGYALAYIVAVSNDANPAIPNTPPTANDAATSLDVAAQSALTIDLSALMSDADGDSVSVTRLYSSNERATINSDTQVRYTPGHFRGVDQFTYLATDSKGGLALGTITITVTDSTPPLAPIASLDAYPQAFMLEVGQSKTIDVAQSVVAQELESWSLTQVRDTSGLGTISAQTDKTFNYAAENAGMGALDYTVQGGDLTANSQVVMVINRPTTPENTRPEANNVEITTLNNKNVVIDLQNSVSDIDGDSLTINELISATKRFTLNGHQVTFTPDGFVGLDQAVYSVSDGNGGYALAYIVAISNDANPVTPNTSPTAQDLERTIDTASVSTWSIDLATLNLIADADGDALTLSHLYAINNRAVKQGNTGITYTPGDFRGIDQVTYVVSDGNGGFAIGSITIVVNDSTPANKIPVANIISGSMLSNESTLTLSVASSVSDADGDSLTIVRLLGALGEAKINPSNGLEIIYRPNGFVGIDRIVYIVSDGKGGNAMATATVEVKAANPNPPTAGLAQTNTMLDQAVDIDLSTAIFDVETPAASLTITAISSATLPATATLSGQTVSYTPNGYTGVDILTYTVSDGEHSSTGDMVVAVNAYDAHPINANTINRNTAPNTPITIDLNSAISTADSTAGALTVDGYAGAVLGDVVIRDNTLTYSPKPGVYGKDIFVYTVKDSHNPAHYGIGAITVNITQPAAPEITALTVERATGGAFIAKVTCARCDNTKYKYQWSINGLSISETNTYTQAVVDKGFNIRLEVQGEDAYQQKTTREHAVYKPNYVKTIYGNAYAFAALKEDGSVITWGANWGGGASSNSIGGNLNSGVKAIYTTNYTSRAFAALKEDGSVVTWGDAIDGGNCSTPMGGHLASGVKTIAATGNPFGKGAFAALKEDGSVVTWGDATNGGDSSSVRVHLTSGVKAIYSSGYAFAALKENGSVITWGNTSGGGDSSSPMGGSLDSGVTTIYNTLSAFAALKEDGSVVTWGPSSGGADSSSVSSSLTSDVETIDGSINVFAALKKDGSVVTWGNISNGGNSSNPIGGNLTSEVIAISHNDSAFAALKKDGSVVTWGHSSNGGDSSTVSSSLTSGVKTIYGSTYSSSAGYGAFAALKTDGSVVTWGNSTYGGDSSSVSEHLTSGVTSICTGDRAFAALKKDGSVVTWGTASNGGDSSSVSSDLTSGVMAIFCNDSAFAALKEDGSVVTWGNNTYGGNSSAVKAKLIPNLILLATSIP